MEYSIYDNSFQLDYDILKNRLPKNVEPAYDGLSINL